MSMVANYYKVMLYISLGIYTTTFALNDHTLTFFIQPYPEVLPSASRATSLPNSHKGFSALLKDPYPFSTAGIIILYAGYMTTSTINGQVTFPFITPRPEFNILVTPFIRPIFMLGSTIHHWELVPTLPARNYTIVRKKDPKTGLFYWESHDAALPKKNIIPLNSIVILGKPSSIVVPSGITLTSDSPQLILPTMYARYDLNRITPAIHSLSIKNFFGPIKEFYKKYNDNYYAKQIETRQNQ